MELHRYWRFRVADARRTFGAFASPDDLLASTLSERVAPIRHRSELDAHLVMLRLDPRDDETWAAVLNPGADEDGRHRAAASRLMLLLAELCVDGGELDHVPSFTEALFRAAGWSEEETELCLRGRPIVDFFAEAIPFLAATVNDCRHWLAGGWLDEGTASRLAARLREERPSFEDKIPAVADGLGRDAGIEPSYVVDRLVSGLDQLDNMFSRAENDSYLWLIQD